MHQTVTLDAFPLSNYLLANNNHPYSHVIKLPDARFRVIRFLRYSAISGSVTRRGKQRSGDSPTASRAGSTTGKVLSGPVIPEYRPLNFFVSPKFFRRGTKDPFLPFFGSERKERVESLYIAYPYAWHLHRTGIRIAFTSAYASSIHMRNICLY